MTATNIYCAKRHDAVYVVTDAASYDSEGIVRKIASKVYVAHAWPGVITGRGNAYTLGMLSLLLEQRFDRFDDVVSGIEQALPLLVAEHGLSTNFELIVAGLSIERRAPESYVIYASDELPKGARKKAGSVIPTAYKLTRLPDSGVWGPQLPAAENLECAFDPNGSPDDVAATMRAGIEVQRRTNYDGRGFRIGGFAELTTVSLEKGVEQRWLCEWPEDEIGEKITPANKPESLSPSKRRMQEKRGNKIGKHARRELFHDR